MRILVSGGGTAGHITPILATIDALKSLAPEVEILYVGQKGSMEDKIARAAGLEFAAISAGKLRRYNNISLIHKLTDLSTMALNTRDIFKVVGGVSQSLGIIRRYKPNLIFIKGGYVGLPVGLAAAILRVPYIIHESDIRPGLTNKILSKRAKKIAVGFPVDKYAELPMAKLVYTGNPIRQQILGGHRLEGLAKFQLDERIPVILIVGGSQGARAINDVLIEALPALLDQYQIIHISGERDIEHVRFQVGRLKLNNSERYKVFSFLSDDLALALAVADLVITRGGANTLAELAILAKPAIVIPAPQLSDQTANAVALARTGAIKVIAQARLNTGVLVGQINQIMQSEKEQKYLSDAIKQFAMPDAGVKLAKLILDQAQIKESA